MNQNITRSQAYDYLVNTLDIPCKNMSRAMLDLLRACYRIVKKEGDDYYRYHGGFITGGNGSRGEFGGTYVLIDRKFIVFNRPVSSCMKHLGEIVENIWDTQLSGKVNFFEITYEELRRLVAEIEIDGLTQVEINIISGMLMEMVEEFLELVYGEIE